MKSITIILNPKYLNLDTAHWLLLNLSTRTKVPGLKL